MKLKFLNENDISDIFGFFLDVMASTTSKISKLCFAKTLITLLLPSTMPDFVEQSIFCL